jgi:sulfur-oxidizing protein SoxY
MPRFLSAMLLACLTVLLPPAAGRAAEEEEQDRWPQIQDYLFGKRPVEDGHALLAIDAPYRAEDAAVVPITIKSLVPQTGQRFIDKLYLVIDNNPAPVAGVFHLSPLNGKAEISTRVRIDQYTTVRAIAEMSDGKLYMTTAYVKAAGGCSAPAGKDPEAAAARLGKMKLVMPATLRMGQPNTFQLLFSHPNSSGMQFDQMSRLYIPPHYVKSITVTYEGAEVLKVDTDISLSEDPSIHFTFVPQKPGQLKAVIIDSKDKEYTNSWAIGAATGM